MNAYINGESAEVRAIKDLTRALERKNPEPTARPVWTLDVTFVHDANLRAVLERNIRELDEAQARGLVTAALVLAGSISEGLLFYALSQRKVEAMKQASVPRFPKGHASKSGQRKDILTEEWTLADYIAVAEDIRLFRAGTRVMADNVLRSFRNMIHPRFQMTKGLTPDVHKMQGSLAWLGALAEDVKTALPTGP